MACSPMSFLLEGLVPIPGGGGSMPVKAIELVVLGFAVLSLPFLP